MLKIKLPIFVSTICIISLLSIPYQSLSTSQKNQWKYSKNIEVEGDAQYKSFFLDDEVYRYASPDLVDLRIIDDKGEFVAYYLASEYHNKEQQTILYDCKIINSFDKNYNAYTDFRVIPFKDSADVIINKLSLTIDNQNFAKTIDIFGSHDNINWTYIKNTNIYTIQSHSSFEVTFETIQRYSYYRIVIPNNLEAVDIKSIQGEWCYTEEEIIKSTRSANLQYEIEDDINSTAIVLNNINKLRINQITIQTDEVFNRKYEIFIREGNFDMPWGVGGEIYNLQFKDIDIKNTNINFSNKPIVAELIVVKIFNKDDRPLDIKNIKMEYLVDKLVFKDVGSQDYSLFFGNPSVTKPFYDIENHKAFIEMAEQDLCQLGQLDIKAEVDEHDKSNAIDYGIAFNIIIVLIALLLVAIIGRKLLGIKSEN